MQSGDAWSLHLAFAAVRRTAWSGSVCIVRQRGREIPICACLLEQRTGLRFERLDGVAACGKAQWRLVKRGQLHQCRSQFGRVAPSIPNLAAAYAEQNMKPVIPAVEESVIRRPERWRRRTGSAARATFIGPNSSVSTWSRTCSVLSSSKKPAWKFPALLTSTSMRPKRSTAAATAA